MTPGEEFSCENDLADQLIEQGRATLVDDNGRTPVEVEVVVPDTKDDKAVVDKTAAVAAAKDEAAVAVDKAVVTGTKTKATLEAEVAADEAALAQAEVELAAPGPLPESV